MRFETNSRSNAVETERQQLVEQLPEIEIKKGDFEIKIIEEADRITSEVIGRYGMTASPVAQDSIHIVQKSKWPNGVSEAFMSREAGAIVAQEDDPDLLLLKIVHEMFHLKGVNSLPEPLTEAIIERLTNEALNLDNTALIGAEKFSGTYTYNEYRKTLDALLKKVVETQTCLNIDTAYAFSFFAKAHLSGSLHHLDFLDDIFGQGTLEELSQLSNDPKDFNDFVSRL